MLSEDDNFFSAAQSFRTLLYLLAEVLLSYFGSHGWTFDPLFWFSHDVPETLLDEVLGKMSAPPKSDVPVITPNELSEADGFVFGFPTRFGMMAAQFKAFLDATGGLWRAQQLAGKPAGLFYSTGSQGGGQETTALTAITQLVHHGMIFVPIGYTFGAGMFEMEKVKGGSPYGAGTYAGDGSRQPSELELQQAFHQGKYIAGITKKLKQAA
ncbi:putative NAD(P)H dehydrogenase (quinone) FQR1-like 1 [Glycine max]|nr:putative NAD(P)H dehydrogenase (quinone) FQR1-like 1 [Glycine max]